MASTPEANEKLIEKLYELLQALDERVAKVEQNVALANTLRDLKSDITKDIINKMDSSEFVDTLAKQIYLKIRNANIGVV